MSIAQILQIIRNHTGTHASDTVKITHQEAVDMIAAADENGFTPIGARSLLLEALTTFGGNEIHPDIFSSPEDKAAIGAAAIKGIETADKFAKLPPKSQLKFIRSSLALFEGSSVGFSSSTLRTVPADVQTKIDAVLQSVERRAGQSISGAPHTTVQAFMRNAQPYGYEGTAFWDSTVEPGGTFFATFYLGPSGDLLQVSTDEEPPDDG
jgi:hypothetical protein